MNTTAEPPAERPAEPTAEPTAERPAEPTAATVEPTAEPPAERPAEPTAEPPAEPTAKTHRRTLLIVGAAAVVGIGVTDLPTLLVIVAAPALGSGVVALSKNEVKVTGRAPSGGGWTLDHPVNVRGDTRQQAYGPGRSLRKPVQIAPYSKGPGIAA